MKCPNDEKTLETRQIHSVEVEECPQCQGLWFQKGELQKAKDVAQPELSWLDFELWSDPESFSTEWSSRRCPHCDRKMATIAYGTTGVAVEYCLDRHGIWLDKGEFQAILTALETEVQSKSTSDYVRASLDEAGELLSGQEGFISDWNDLITVVRLLQYRVLVDNPKVAELLTALQSTTPLR